MGRYAANLLLQYQVREAPQARPLCERRIVVFKARSGQAAIKQARQLGKAAQYRYKNADGQTVSVTFVGLVDVLDIDWLDPNEVYWSMRRTADPKRHVRPDGRLSVSKDGSKTIGASWWAVPAFLVKGRANSRPRDRRRRRGA